MRALGAVYIFVVVAAVAVLLVLVIESWRDRWRK